MKFVGEQGPELMRMGDLAIGMCECGHSKTWHPNREHSWHLVHPDRVCVYCAKCTGYRSTDD